MLVTTGVTTLAIANRVTRLAHQWSAPPQNVNYSCKRRVTRKRGHGDNVW